MPTDPLPDNRSRLHPRLTVAPGAGQGRLIDACVLGPADLAEAALEVANERSAERVAVRARLDAATARALHDLDAATARVASARTAHQHLLDSADWAEAAHRGLDDQAAAIDAARALFEARRAEQRAARERLDLVLEQRAAAAVAMRDADEQVGDLDGIGMDEMGLRRELEAAGEAAGAAHGAHAAAVAAVQRLTGEQASLERRASVLREQLAGRALPGVVAPEAIERVEAAAAEWTRAARGGGVDNYSQALADAFTELLADLAEHERLQGPVPDQADIDAARAAMEAAAVRLREVEAAIEAAGLSPDERAEIDAAHAAVVAAAERAERRLAGGGSQRRLAEAQAAERALLERHGFGGYLEVVLTGGRPATARPDRTAAERAYVASQGELERLLRAAQPTPELEHLHSERARLLAHIVDRLGVDPGDRVVELLRAHPMLPGAVVDELGQALAAVDVRPVGVSLVDAALAWLGEQAVADEAGRVDRAEVQAIEAELAGVLARAEEVELELGAARAEEAEAVERLEMATRSVGAVEAELTSRTGEDTTRYQRYVAAQQLRAQVEALSATLAHAEHDATSVFDAVTRATEEAEVALDRALGALDDVARRAREVAEELPADQRPVGDRLATLLDLAARLRARAVDVQPAIGEAEADAALVSEKVDAARAEAEAAGTGLDGPRPEDVLDGIDRLLARSRSEPVVLDEPFMSTAPDAHDELRARLLAAAEACQVVLLTDDPATLGWAIGLPEHQAAVVSTDSALNLFPRVAEVKGTDLATADLATAPTARLSVGPH